MERQESEASILDSEIMMLDSIYPGEFIFERPPDHPTSENNGDVCYGKFSMTIRPATAGDENAQNTSLLLQLLLPSDYPTSLPVIRFYKPRGLSDFQLVGLMKLLEGEAEKRCGEGMIFDLVDILRDFLTRTNFPSVECPFCLCDIEEGDEFFKSECFHYCHMYCLRRYVEFVRAGKAENGRNSVENCIVCRMPFREAIALDEWAGLAEPPSVCAATGTFAGSEEREKEGEWRRRLFELQRTKNGLIDPEPEHKFVITLNHIPEVDRIIRPDS